MNEVWFFIITVVDLALILLAWRLGPSWVYVTIVANVILVSTFAAKLIVIFGLVTNVSNSFYAAIFLATDILTEHRGKREGYRSVWMGFLGLVLFILMGQGVLQIVPHSSSEAVSTAMETLFSAVPRIAAASFVAYAIAQSFDVWFYHYLRIETSWGRLLWMRNCASTVTSQLLDSVIFFTLAFVGTVSFTTLLTIIFTGWLVKCLVALLDTPMIYLSYVVIGKKMPGILRRGEEAPQQPRAAAGARRRN